MISKEVRTVSKNGDKYEAILEAAVKVISADGYRNSQVKKIAKEAGVAGGTVYLYFNNKEELIVDVFNKFLNNLIDRVRLETQKITDSKRKLKKLVEAHLAQVEANYDLAVVCFVELRQPDPVLRKVAGIVLRRYFNFIEQVVEEGQANGSFNPRLNKQLARQMIFGTLDEIVTSWVLNRRTSLAGRASQIYKMLLNGLTY